MAMKIMVDIQGNVYDFWEFRSLEKGEQYNDIEEKVEYTLILNKSAIALNFTEVIFVYPTEQERDEELARIKAKLVENDGVVLI